MKNLISNSNPSYRQKIEKAKDFLAQKFPFFPKVVIVLGTGLSGVAEEMEKDLVIPYAEIPYFPRSTVESHKGNLILGRLSDLEIAVFQGRFHFYEGYSTKEITFPLRVLTLLGAKLLIISNAAGGLDLSFKPGDLMLIADHINFIPENPLRGENYEDWGPRFPDLSEAYSKRLRHLVKAVAEGKIDLQEGVYVAVPGPSLETPAETRFLRLIGADAVGMSTVPEVIVAKHAGLEVLGLSVIANVNDPDNFQPILLEDVIANAQKAEKKMLFLIKEFLNFLPKDWLE
ncbi:inosine guanosine and xanthosine phosphorylase family [Thermodesulfatator indicus DSM 15286]|uniref:Purine nucleoside phosphorylase n=1 Tax=Thermodesulfatator indicus (strain DSM 15286 / JCM 11887 / CIR29812) TaxID=667014 RepID=F8A7Y7_THEID|nr:purine-nucleoside phosphorylase [Thermodesulfatator indicus]AEH43903.1 inosine guanosine and xanthosine phosphorylase family [Thermodesulfatator indicus DSM 15286]